MKQALIKLIESSKFWTTLIGIAATFAAKYGLQVDAATQAEIAGLFVMLLGGQAAADHGKEAAKVNAALALAADPIAARNAGRIVSGTLPLKPPAGAA